MGKRNGYLDRKAQRDIVMQEATRQTYVQYMTDILVMTLNDPAVMGKDVFGKTRITKVLKECGKKYDTYHAALEKGGESDYFRVKIDEAIKRIIGESDFVPFDQRYEWLAKISYDKK